MDIRLGFWRDGTRMMSTYSQIEHARLLRGAEVGALGDLGVGVELEIVQRVVS